jgi:hypothetical protein
VDPPFLYPNGGIPDSFHDVAAKSHLLILGGFGGGFSSAADFGLLTLFPAIF